MAQPPKVAIIIYSQKGHIAKLAESIRWGLISSIPNATIDIFRVNELLTAEELKYYKVDAVMEPFPLATSDLLGTYDGYLLGFPTRFGSVPAQMSAFLHNTSKQWISGSMRGKLGGAFTSTASQHGGQETSIQHVVSWFTHMGTLFHPLGYADEALQEEEEVVGGSPWGAASVAGRWANLGPSQKELDIAKTQGKEFGVALQALHAGRQVMAKTT